jgi:cytochrome b
MKQIWDLPTRLFHAAFAGSILAAFALGKFASEHSQLFALHMFFGALAGLLLLWRIVWGFIGTRHARFSSLLFSPGRIVEYFASVLGGKGQYFAGHNPGSSLAIWAMLILAAVSVVSGLSMGFMGETFEEVHEIATVLLIAAAAFHVAGVILASVMHRESYALSMITGRKTASASEAIPTSSPAAALVMILLVTGTMTYIGSGFDLSTASFSAPGTSFSVQFGEGEEEGESEGGEHEEEEEDDD